MSEIVIRMVDQKEMFH